MCGDRGAVFRVNHSCRFLLPHRDMLPKFQELLIDAHGSDVPSVSLSHFTLFC